jgi:hypothetical protein
MSGTARHVDVMGSADPAGLGSVTGPADSFETPLFGPEPDEGESDVMGPRDDGTATPIFGAEPSADPTDVLRGDD